MIDTNIYRQLKRGRISASSYGTAVGEDVAPTEEKYAGQLVVVSWGIGRSDFDPTINIPLNMEQKLKSFWRAYFHALPKRPACVSFSNIASGPVDLPIRGACSPST
jgi:hypothetical protein